jgi:hypothetical protein
MFYSSVIKATLRVFIKGIYIFICLILVFPICLFMLPGCKKPSQPSSELDFVIFHENLTNGFDIGLDTNEKRRDWLKISDGTIQMQYPKHQRWGAVFIVVGIVTEKPRPSLDFSSFSALALDLRSAAAIDSVEIGIKDNKDPDTGTETKVKLHINSSWHRYELKLDQFKTANLKQLYVVTEFVFSGSSSAIYCRDIRYLK